MPSPSDLKPAGTPAPTAAAQPTKPPKPSPRPAKEPAWTFDQHLLPRERHTQVAADGLHYASKAPGSPFAALNGFACATMSCFLCGRHRPRTQMKSRRLAGRPHLVCEPACGSPPAPAEDR